MSNQKLESTRSGLTDRTPFPISRTLLLEPSGFEPSNPSLSVVGTHNPGFLQYEKRRILAVRVDEVLTPSAKAIALKNYRADSAVPYLRLPLQTIEAVPVVKPENYDPDEDYLTVNPSFRSADRDAPERLYLNYLAHIELLELSSDDTRLSSIEKFLPSSANDKYGCEDPRLALVDDTAVLSYNGIGGCGSTIHRCVLDDAKRLKSRELILPPDHKHACIFKHGPRERYFMLARPLVRMHFQDSGVWLYSSPDCLNWQPVGSILNPRPRFWDGVRVGPGSPPILTSLGWLFFYYGVDKDRSYHVGAAILDAENPSKVLFRSLEPIFSPSLDWECKGRRADVVFPSGVEVLKQLDAVNVYYGAADTFVGRATFRLSDLICYLRKCKNVLHKQGLPSLAM